MTTTHAPAPVEDLPATAAPGPGSKLVLGAAVAVPLAALLVGVPLALVHGWVTWVDLAMLVTLYYIGLHGITIGYHRLFTHSSFRAAPWLRTVLAVAGSVAVEGRVIDWVADHRKHHQFSDKGGDPHSPWEHGPGAVGLAKGLWHAHIGWVFTYSGTDLRKYAPDLLQDRAIERVSRLWPLIALATFALPAAVGFAFDGWEGALRAFFWAGVVRLALVHHMTWSINSVCHVWGSRPFASRDHSANVAVFAPFSGGESWHNYHHADPSSARHGVLRGQVDTSAVIIRALERLGWVSAVKWPSDERVASKLAS